MIITKGSHLWCLPEPSAPELLIRKRWEISGSGFQVGDFRVRIIGVELLINTWFAYSVHEILNISQPRAVEDYRAANQIGTDCLQLTSACKGQIMSEGCHAHLTGLGAHLLVFVSSPPPSRVPLSPLLQVHGVGWDREAPAQVFQQDAPHLQQYVLHHPYGPVKTSKHQRSRSFNIKTNVSLSSWKTKQQHEM